MGAAVDRTRTATLRGILVTLLVAALAVSMLVPASRTAEAEDNGPPSVSAEVTLEFEGQPGHAAVDETITTEPFDVDADPVSVEVGRADPHAQELEALLDFYEGELRKALEQEVAAREQDPDDFDAAIHDAVAQADVEGKVEDAIDDAIANLVLSIGEDPSAGTAELVGDLDKDVSLSGDTVEFDDISIDTAGRGYTLVVTIDDETVDVEVPALETGEVEVDEGEVVRGTFAKSWFDLELSVSDESDDESDRFTIWAHVERCEGAECSVGMSGAGFSVDISSSSGDGVLALNLDEDLCDEIEYQGLPGDQGVLFDAVDNPGDKRATFLIDRDTRQQVRDDGASKYDICFRGDAPFTAKDGTDAPELDEGDPLIADGLQYGPALLPDCRPGRGPNAQDAPCIESRTGASGGAVQIVVRLPAGDPWMR